MKKTRFAFWQSVIALVLCISMLLGSTWAWFTDTASGTNNIITAGNLDLEMYWTDDLEGGQWNNVEEDGKNTIFSYDNWEPGYTEVKYLKLVNAGKLALNYELLITPQGGVGKLAEVINVFVGEDTGAINSREDLTTTDGLGAIGLLDHVLEGGITAKGTLLAKDEQSPFHKSGETVITVAMNMITTAGNEYQNEDAGKFTITALATQAPYEKDSFGADYDANAEMPEVIVPVAGITVPVTPVNGAVGAGGVTMAGEGVSAIVPEGTLLSDGATELTLTVTPLENTTSDITVVNNEILIPVDVHIEGVAENNTTPIIVNLGAILPKYLNMGNYKLAHVEDGVTNYMEYLEAAEEFTAHNQYKYDPLTGETTVAMASFSEVVAVSEPAAWEGGFDDTWYDADATELTIANADQLAAFGAIVGGMKGYTKDNFDDKYIKLVSDINLGDAEEVNQAHIFYPIGYYYTLNNETTVNYEYVDRNNASTQSGVTSNVSSFKGTFDGNGHTVYNFYQNTWEMFGDYNDGYSGTPNYYKDAMGLFGYVNGGTVKNLTVDNFSSDGEFTPTGVIAAYAVNSTFENIAITNCNPRVYNTGNGGIVGIGGNSDDPDDYKLTFTNITIDNTNKITALWGSWDVACGGLVGMFRGAGHVYMTNCHVAAQMDVYNDVCGNYQYYWYRYSGMMVGTNKNMTTDEAGYTVPETDKFHAENCTVHFGEWNDYYYCELVANSLASYTHDHQFSRLTEISSLDEIKSGDTWTKTGNFLLIDGDKKTCYHIVNKDGVLTQHNHEDAGTEVVNGETVPKEDKQIVYLPFNQLFTGYGWGVKHIPIYDDGTPNPFAGVTVLDREVADSVEKFTKNQEFNGTLESGIESVTIGTIFDAIDESAVGIKPETIMVAVTDLTKTGITADFVRGTDGWDSGTLNFHYNGSNSGIVNITIQDYYFCKPTTVQVNIGDFKTTDRFAVKFENTDKYLYRVGNVNDISISSLFGLAEGIDSNSIGEVTVNISEAATYTVGSSGWDSGRIKFDNTFTGPVKVTISDDNFSTPVELDLEVVNATNVTAYSGLGNKNSVLLNDIRMSSGGKYSLYDNKTLYGNGFTFNVEDGLDSDTEGGYVGGNGTVWVRNSTLDNVKIVGEVYTQYGGTVKSEYNFPTVLVLGDSVIANSYISNGCAPVRVGSGCNIEIINSTLEGGIFANLDIRGGTVKLKDVTTINQSTTDGKSISNDEGVVGLGIVVYAGSTVTIDADGLTQYNCISENTTFKAQDANTLKTVIFGNNYKNYQFDYDGATWVNTGILSMVEEVKGENISEIKGYVGQDASISSYNGYVYAPKGLTSVATPDDYSASAQYQIAPTYTFDYTTKNNVPQVSGSNDYCYYDESTQKYLISFDDGETFTWDADILSITKGEATIVPSISVSDGATVNPDNTITFDASGDYTVTYKYTDGENYRLNANDKIEKYSADYEKTVRITVYEVQDTSAKTEFAFGNNRFRTETANNLTYVMPDVNATVDSNTAGIGVTTIGGVNIYYPIVSMHKSGSSSWYNYFSVFEAVTITDLDGTVHSTNSTELPSGLTVVGGFILDASGNVSTAESANGTGIFNYSTGKEIKCSTYSSYGLCYYPDSQFSMSTNSRDEQTIVAKYRYTDSNGTPYYYYVGYWCEKHTKSSVCVTPDTLVTLADGTQKEIQYVTYEDQLLVWDFYKGEYTVMPSSIVMNHGYNYYDVVTLNFDDGTTVNTINGHGFFDTDSNKFVILGKDNAADYIGHSFVKDAAAGTTAKLVSYSIKNEYTESWSILTAVHYNCILEGMLTLTPAEVDGSPEYLMPYEIGEDMKYIEDAMQADIDAYGLYTYEDFEEYMTYEQFAGLGLANFKVSVAKGYITWEEILYLISIHIG